MKNLVISTLAILLLVCLSNTSSAQRLILEMKTFGQKYKDAIRHDGGYNLYLGYELSKRWDAGIEIEGNRVSHNVRLLDANQRSTNWIGVASNLLTLSNDANWTKSSKKEIQKGYIRNMTSFKLQANYYLSPNFRISFGPSVQIIKALTESTDDVTYEGGLFSDLEFDQYSNLTLTGGIEYLRPFSSWSYWTAGIDLQKDIYSSSSKIKNSKFIGEAITYSIGIGFWIGKSSKKVEETKTDKIPF